MKHPARRGGLVSDWPERWPAGAPGKYDLPYERSTFDGPDAVLYEPARPVADAKLGPMHGGYHDIDSSPSLDYLIENRDNPKIRPYFEWATAKRPREELYDITVDPGCIDNLAEDPAYAEVKNRLWEELSAALTKTGDPRMAGSDIFESYRRYCPLRYFPIPDWAEDGEVPTPSWIQR